MSRYCLDTSAYSHFQRGDPAVVELIDGAEWIGLPAVVLGELRVGLRLGGRWQANLAALAEFVAHPVVEGSALTPRWPSTTPTSSSTSAAAGRPFRRTTSGSPPRPPDTGPRS